MLPCSTGVIGWRLPLDSMVFAMPEARRVAAGRLAAARRARDHDDRPLPEAARPTRRRRPPCGIAKGAGMIEPNMATMLAFVRDRRRDPARRDAADAPRRRRRVVQLHVRRRRPVDLGHARVRLVEPRAAARRREGRRRRARRVRGGARRRLRSARRGYRAQRRGDAARDPRRRPRRTRRRARARRRQGGSELAASSRRPRARTTPTSAASCGSVGSYLGSRRRRWSSSAAR